MISWTAKARTAIGRYSALHNEGELACLLGILDAEMPEKIIEIGTWAGGSAWAFDQLATVQMVITIDPAPQPQAVETLRSLNCETHLIQLRSQDHEAYVTAAQLVKPSMADVLFIDGDHTYEAARHDFETYSKLVRRGGLVVIHDTQGYPGNDTVQVPMLWKQVRDAYRTIELVAVPGGPGGTGLVWL